jgi:hypothetical protein
VNNSEIQAEEQKAIELEELGNETAALEIWLRLAQVRPPGFTAALEVF